MNFKFFPQTKEEIEQMLKQAGMNSLDDLYADVPEQIRFRGEYDLPEPMSETEIRSLFEKLGEKNRRLTVFAGAGCYDHYTPEEEAEMFGLQEEILTAYGLTRQ